MANKLIDMARHFQPHFILFGHTDILPSSTYEKIRFAVNGVRLATFCVDALFRKETMDKFKQRALKMDTAFITTGDREKLKKINMGQDHLYFMPNPVDPSMGTAQVFEVSQQELAYDGQFLGTGIGERETQLNTIKEGLPEDIG